jgi:hypothetical protein
VLASAAASALSGGVSLLDMAVWEGLEEASAAAAATRPQEQWQQRYGLLTACAAVGVRRAVASSIDAFQHAVADAVHGALGDIKVHQAAAAACGALYTRPASVGAVRQPPPPPQLFPAMLQALNSVRQAVDCAQHVPIAVPSAVRAALRSATAETGAAVLAAVSAKSPVGIPAEPPTLTASSQLSLRPQSHGQPLYATACASVAELGQGQAELTRPYVHASLLLQQLQSSTSGAPPPAEAALSLVHDLQPAHLNGAEADQALKHPCGHMPTAGAPAALHGWEAGAPPHSDSNEHRAAGAHL